MHAFQTSFLPKTAHAGEGAARGWRWAGLSCPKSLGDGTVQANDDAWFARSGDTTLDLAVVDVATQKRGITGVAIQEILQQTFQDADRHVSPGEILNDAHGRLLDQLKATHAKGAACLMIVRLDADGHCQWAHAGDAVLAHWQPPTTFRNSRLHLLNTRHREGHGLTQGVGIQRESGVQFEEGMLTLAEEDRLLMMTDGVFHDAMTIDGIRHWIDAHELSADTCLPCDLVRKIEAEARFTQPRADDSTLVLIERKPPIQGGQHAA